MGPDARGQAVTRAIRQTMDRATITELSRNRSEPVPDGANPSSAIAARCGLPPERGRVCPSAFALLWARQQADDGGAGIDLAREQRLDGARDRHVDAAGAGELHQRPGRRRAFDELAAAGFGDRAPAAQGEAEREIAGLRGRAGEHEIAQAREAHQRVRPGSERIAETPE